VKFNKEKIMELDNYKRLIFRGFIDISTKRMTKNGTVKFRHIDFEYSVHASGWVRRTTMDIDAFFGERDYLHPLDPMGRVWSCNYDKMFETILEKYRGIESRKLEACEKSINRGEQHWLREKYGNIKEKFKYIKAKYM
jgi:hypothetical protein